MRFGHCGVYGDLAHNKETNVKLDQNETLLKRTSTDDLEKYSYKRSQATIYLKASKQLSLSEKPYASHGVKGTITYICKTTYILRVLKIIEKTASPMLHRPQPICGVHQQNADKDQQPYQIYLTFSRREVTYISFLLVKSARQILNCYFSVGKKFNG